MSRRRAQENKRGLEIQKGEKLQDKKNKHKRTKLVVNNRLKIKINGKKIHSKLIDYFLVSCYYYYR